MAAPFHDIEEKGETALKEYIDANTTLTGVTFHLGFDSAEIVTPSLEVFCSEAVPEMIGETATGNWYLTMEVTLRTHVEDTTRLAHGEFVAEVRDVLIMDIGDVVTAINALGAKPTDFTAHQWIPGPAAREVDEEKNQRLTIQTGTLFCEPSD